ncbi:MAG: adenylosuccinate lyase [Anaerolineae bacterium]
MTFSHDSYLSPMAWRYGSPAMRAVWSEANKRRLWRRVWLALARAQHAAGLVTAEQVADLAGHVAEVDIERAHAIEAEIHHDLMSEVRVFAEQACVGGPIIHLGATSQDIEDNADVLRIRAALDLLLPEIARLLGDLADGVERWADRPCMGYTHVQPAEPTTVGYRLAQTAQDLLADYETLRSLRARLRGKGFKGAVGTSASYAEVLQGTGMASAEMERLALADLGLDAFPVTTQVYPRKQDWLVLTALAAVAQTLHKLAFDIRILQSPVFGEWSEPFGRLQVGSSAMPFKRNPINSEKIDSLARYIAALPTVLWHDAANNLLERTLDDSANRRLVLPDAFLACDEIVRTAQRIVRGLRVDEAAIERQLQTYGVFSATERVLMAVVKAGGDRQATHEVIREHSLAAWTALQQGQPNPLPSLLAGDERLTRYVPADTILARLDASEYVGDAPERSRAMAAAVRAALAAP